MKKILTVIATFFCSIPTFANHISGGELFYEYLGAGTAANTSKYLVTMRLFRDCKSTGQVLDGETVNIGIYKANGMAKYTTLGLPLRRPIRTIELTTSTIPCLTNAPDVCYQIGIFSSNIELPNTADGYILTWVRCCRPDDLGNMSVPTNIGATFVTNIPGTSVLAAGHNSSPEFLIKDTALVCQNKNFILDFGATDKDGDSLSYAFCNAYSGGTSAIPNPGMNPKDLPATLTLNSLPYQSPFSGNEPLGSPVSLNTHTGKITGKAPSAGRYVINVCVTEWRNGVALNEHRKDFILAVGNCDFAEAEPVPLTGAWCKSFTVNFSNNNTSSTIQSYYWDFGVKNLTTDTSTKPIPDYTYSDTGMYTIKLVVRGAAGCVDSGITILGVYPNFKADFDFTGSCFQNNFEFHDKTTFDYGYILSRSWDFGDESVTSDTSSAQDPFYKYPGPANNRVFLTTVSNKGCSDTISKIVSVNDIPSLKLPFTDTLICSQDTLQLHVEGAGAIRWSPADNILNANSPDPLVFPKDTTTYYVQLSENGCTNTDSVRVAVIDAVSLNAGADTTICLSDTVTLRPASNALYFSWSPDEGLVTQPDIKNPAARPAVTTTYFVTASVGKCKANDEVIVKVVPYPHAEPGNDVSICYGNRAQLSASIVGSSFQWMPANLLENATSLTPIAGPTTTTTFTLTVYDTLGCPKPYSDTVRVTVIPPVKAFAGNDTTIVVSQPLQLNATGGTIYAWSPSTGMDNPFIANPVVVLNSSFDTVVFKVRVSVPAGCFAEDEVKVRVFKTGPDIFIPSAFTPNHDGKNDVLRPIPVGVVSLNYFRVYNRWGELVYSTQLINDGWDGTLHGKEQGTGTYVYMAEGIDYLGKSIFKKGTAVLIR